MSDNKTAGFKPSIDQYPWRIILIRWFLLAVEGGIAIYLISSIRLELVVFYIAYGVISLFLLLPLIRCVRCGYYGKRCNFGWGRWVARFFTYDDKNPYASFYGYTIIFWPLRLLPIIAGIRTIPTVIFDQPTFLPHGLFVIYIVVMILHRLFYRGAACTRCHQRDICPVYKSSAVLTTIKNTQ
jgi:hypothetical protein